jgi:transposase
MARSAQLADLFRHPALVTQRNYEICKAYYLEGTPAQRLAQRFALHPDSVRAIVRDFARQPDLEQFFVINRPGPRAAPKREQLAAEAARLRRRGLSLADIQQRLQQQGRPVSQSYLCRILQRQGLSGARPSRPGRPSAGQRARDGSEVPAAADVRRCSWQPGRGFDTRVAGLFLFVPLLLELDVAAAVRAIGASSTTTTKKGKRKK